MLWLGASNAVRVSGLHPWTSGELQAKKSGGEAVTNTAKRTMYDVGDPALASCTE